MEYVVNGLADIYTVLSNERRVGGVIETGYIQLRDGQHFPCSVITSIERIGAANYYVGFITEEGKRFLSHIDEITLISQPVHKRICQMSNGMYKQMKIDEKLKYLKKLCQINEGSRTPVFEKEVKQIAEDIGMDAAGAELDLSFIEYSSENERKINRKRIA
ncbi:hypothetical protein [Aneurinibacillus tyrosinisolvens]|uniref:hypothetical protein n=1 Tax=Aneurinibacillus tyrosinisolvens TaxID=1443435 RepID=UPI00063F384F|nr:hypothetical protein [Aneurinibacillus tyrosinisolvens]